MKKTLVGMSTLTFTALWEKNEYFKVDRRLMDSCKLVLKKPLRNFVTNDSYKFGSPQMINGSVELPGSSQPNPENPIRHLPPLIPTFEEIN